MPRSYAGRQTQPDRHSRWQTHQTSPVGTQSQSGNACRIARHHFSTNSKYENGGNRISASRLWDCACVLDVPVQFFFQDMDAETCMLSPRMRNYTPEKIAELAVGKPLAVANDIMSSNESILLVSSYNRIPNRQLAKYLFAVMVNLGRCTSFSVENDDTEEEPRREKSEQNRKLRRKTL